MNSIKAVSYTHLKSLKELRQRSDVKWTYVSPAAEFEADGIRTGEYILEMCIRDRVGTM